MTARRTKTATIAPRAGRADIGPGDAHATDGGGAYPGTIRKAVGGVMRSIPRIPCDAVGVLSRARFAAGRRSGSLG